MPFYFYQFSCIFQEKKNYQSSLASRMVEGNEDFEKNMRDLVVFITAFRDVVSPTMDIHKPCLLTKMVGGANNLSHHRGGLDNQIQIVLYTTTKFSLANCGPSP